MGTLFPIENRRSPPPTRPRRHPISAETVHDGRWLPTHLRSAKAHASTEQETACRQTKTTESPSKDCIEVLKNKTDGDDEPRAIARIRAVARPVARPQLRATQKAPRPQVPLQKHRPLGEVEEATECRCRQLRRRVDTIHAREEPPGLHRLRVRVREHLRTRTRSKPIPTDPRESQHPRTLSDLAERVLDLLEEAAERGAKRPLRRAPALRPQRPCHAPSPSEAAVPAAAPAAQLGVEQDLPAGRPCSTRRCA